MMLDSEKGAAILDRLAALGLDAEVDEHSVLCSLLAACFARALYEEMTPREVVDELFTVLPSCDEWEDTIRERVRGAVDSVINGEGADRG